MTFFDTVVRIFEDTPTPTPTDAAAQGNWFSQNGLMIVLILVLAVMVFFMWRNGRKRRAEQEQLAKQMVPGAEVMTNFGLYGTVKSFDEVGNTAELEIADGVAIKVHRQTLVKVVDQTAAAAGEPGAPRSVEEAMAIAEREQQERESAAKAATEEGEPKFGERLPEAEGTTAAGEAEGDAPKNA